MADAAAFDWLCEQLEEHTSLDRLEARGTVRLALRASGLEARTVTPDQVKVLIEKVLAGELTARGIESAESVCDGLSARLAVEAANLRSASDGGETPDAVFSRLGGS